MSVETPKWSAPELPKAPDTLERFDEPLVDRLLTADEVRLRSELREVIARSVAPGAAARDREGTFAAEPVQALCDAGFGGLTFPAQYGGVDASTVSYAITIEAVAAACPATSLILMTQMHAAYPILLEGTDEQRERWIPVLCDGSALGALGITEPSAGSDAAAIRTTARRTDDGYVVNGSKTFITTGDKAAVTILFATVDKDRGRDGITAFLLPGDVDGLSRGHVLEKLGMHGSTTAELFLDDVHLPESSLLGEEGGAWALSMRTVVKSRISAASQGLGIAAAQYGLAVDWAAHRGLLRDPQWQTQLFRLADLRTEILMARQLLYSVARAVDEEPERDLTAEVGMAKARCTDLGMTASEFVTGLLGPEGDLVDAASERYLRDVKVTQIYDGTNEVQRLLIGRDLTRKAGDGRG